MSLHLRLPRDLLDELRVKAGEQSVSLNMLLTSMLAGQVGWQLEPKTQEGPRRSNGRPHDHHMEVTHEAAAAE